MSLTAKEAADMTAALQAIDMSLADIGNAVVTAKHGTAAMAQLIAQASPPPIPPNAAFTYAPTAAPREFTFTATDATQPSYAFSWGDGSPDGAGPSATHTYKADGKVVVRLTVIDAAGTAGMTQQVLDVVTAPDPIPVPPPSGASVADPLALPVANRQLPDWPAFDKLNVPAMPAGTAFAVPVTSVPAIKLTSALYPAVNTNMVHDYASGGLQIGGPWGADADQYSVYALEFSGAGWLTDINTTARAITGKPRRTPWGSAGRFTFSSIPSTPQLAYYTDSKANIVCYDTRSATTVWRHALGIAAQQLVWLQVDVVDRWFVAMTNAGDTIYAWDSQADRLLTCSVTRCATLRPGFTIDEPHFDRDGRYVYIKGGGYLPMGGGLQGNHLLWDLQTDTLTDLFAAWSHSEGLRGIAAGGDPNSTQGPNQRFDPATKQLATYATDTQLGAGEAHRAGQWMDQGSIGAAQFLLYSSDAPTNNRSQDAHKLAWVMDSPAGVYRTTIGYQYEQTKSGGIGCVHELNAAGTAVAARLDKASSRTAMTRGSWWISGTTLYVWRNDDIAPDNAAHRILAQVPAIVHDGLGLVSLDGHEKRLLGHHYSFNPKGDYWTSPRATWSRDGKVAVLTTNANGSGRLDVLAYLVPTKAVP